MVPKTDKIWLDGKLVVWDEANVHILTHSLHYGLAVFEGIRCYETPDGPAIFRLREHMERLIQSAHIFKIKIPFTLDELCAATVEIVRVNKLSSCYIRPIAFIGAGAMGIYIKGNPIQVAIAAWKWGAYLGEDALNNGIKVRTSSFVRTHVNTNMTRGKVSGYYVNSILSKNEAKECGCDEGLLLDADGFVSEGSGENIFIVRKGKLKTTPLTSILEGITRDSIMTIAEDKGIAVSEQRFTRDEVYIAEEAFFTGTAAEITPIRELDGRIIGSGKPGPITKTVQTAYFDAVTGKDPKYKHWLTYV